MISRARAVVISLALLLIGSLGFIPDAWAAGGVYASACQDGHAGPYDEVFSYKYYPSGSSVRLLCGSPNGKGVLHIIQGRHPHPIAPEDDDAFEGCLSRVFHSNFETKADAGNFAIATKLHSGATATVAWELSTREIVSAYTSDGAYSNDWRGCAAG